MRPFWREGATVATQHPLQAERQPQAEGVLVELASGHPVDVPLHWQRWSLALPLLDAVSTAVRNEAAASLRPPEKAARSRGSGAADGES